MHRFLPVLLVILLIFSALPFRDQIETLAKQWRSGPQINRELTSAEYVNQILSSTGRFDPKPSQAVWFNQKVSLPGADLAQRLAQTPDNVLGISANPNKWIEIDLTTQHLFAHEGDRVAFDFPVSTGLPWLPTVTGEFHIWAKIRAQRMTGGSVENGTFYDLPNVPFVQYFHGGYGLHGAYWHNDFGHPRSHGCVNISIPNSERLYNWTDPALGSGEYARYNIPPEEGTRVVVHGVTPIKIY